MMKAPQKQATKGQAQIYKENRETIKYYSLASTTASLVFLLVHLLLVDEVSWKVWSSFALSILFEALAVGLMISSTRCVRGEKGQIIDAGVDLNSTTSFGEYYKDTVIFGVIIQLLALISSYFFLLLLVLPAYGFYKLWVNYLGPWFFAPPPEEDPMDEKRQRRRQKVVYRR